MRRTMGWIGGIGLLALALVAGYVLVARRWHLGWGATEDERRAPMPGDELVAHPTLVATRAVTIDAPPAAVWPWLVQMGYRRAGWYSYDRFDNDGRVVRRIIPELQHLEVGDVMLTDATGGFRVEAIEPERNLVLMTRGGPGRGDLDISAALGLHPLPDDRTRLVLRLRAELRGRLARAWGAILFDVGDFVMMRRMLLGIRERAETASGRRPRRPRQRDDLGPREAVRARVLVGDHEPTASFQAGLLSRLVPRLHLFGEDGADLATLRRRIERAAPPVVPWARVRVEPVVAGGVPGEWVIPKHPAEDRVLLYLHGGAWVMGSPRTHRALVADLARRAGVRALSIDYRLAPEHPYPAALDDCVASYEWLLASGIEPARVVVAGDSAGGNLALALLLRLRDTETSLPAGAVLLSPVTDLELGGASHVTRKALDPFFARADLRTFIAPYAGTHDPQEPYLSPLGADLRGLPPLLIHVGDREVLLDDAVRLGERAREAGVAERTVVWPGMTHVFQMQTYLLPEARRANAEIGAFIRARVGLPA